MTHEGGRRKGEAGFTLIEALIAIIILVFGLVAITNLMIVAASSNQAANHGTAATTTASQRMEELKGVTFAALPIGGDVEADAGGFNRDDQIPGVGTIHTRWQIVAVDGATRFIRVRSESTSPLLAQRTRAEFTTFRSCTAISDGCPP